MDNLFTLCGKRIVVTGATSPLALSMLQALTTYGGRVAVTGRSLTRCREASAELNENHPGAAIAVEMDVADENSVKKAFAEIQKEWGGVDVLINNAASVTVGRFDELSGEQWAKGMDGTINGMFHATREALPIMLEQGSGHIISIASMYGLVSPDPGIYGDSGQNSPAAYGAGKAAILQLTRYLACHYGRKGIRANAVSPGPFPAEKAQENEAFIQRLSDKTALGRIGKPEELRGIIVFLASDASSYMTGQNISVDGGWTAW